MSIHIGNEIEKKVRERKMTIVRLSRELGCHRTHVYRIFAASSVDTGILSRLSVILQFDFFKLYSEDISSKMSEDAKNDNMM